MRGAVLVAIAATVGNFLQGWDNSTIAGAIVYMKKDLDLEATMEGLIVAMSLIGATAITTCSGAISDLIGRRPMLIMSSILYFIGGLMMVWSPNVYVLLIARLVDGFGIGLAVTLVPLYISETSPPEIRGSLNTLPQFQGSGGMFLAYCMIFGMSLTEAISWRLMLGVLSIPSLLYFILTVFYLPESPRWLVSKGRMLEAKRVLQMLRGREDVSAEMALLVEGLGVGGETSLEEYIIGAADEFAETHEGYAGKEHVKLYGPELGLSWVAKPVTGTAHSTLGLVSRRGSIALMDPMVTLFGSIHEKLPEAGSMRMRSSLFPNFGSMFSTTGPPMKQDEWDAPTAADDDDDDDEGKGYDGGGDLEENLQSPLLSRQTTNADKPAGGAVSHGSVLSMRRHSSLLQGCGAEPAGIGGGWQMAWKWSDDGKRERIYLHEEGVPISVSHYGSIASLASPLEPPELIQAAGLVRRSSILQTTTGGPIDPSTVQPSETALKPPAWSSLLEPGVRHALFVGIGIQILQQFSGINGVLYYTPQILEQAGVEVLLSNVGVSSVSASFLISALTTLLMLPCIAIAMRLVDVSGRRRLLLVTIPILIVSLLVLVVGNVVDLGSVLHAVLSTSCVVVYFCCFVMAYGPIPNILCSEIFPTPVRGVCIAICALVFWTCDIIVTYTLPVMLAVIGLSGIFSIYAFVCLLSWVFIYLKVPETKGMPLEVISEFFAVGAKNE